MIPVRTGIIFLVKKSFLYVKKSFQCVKKSFLYSRNHSSASRNHFSAFILSLKNVFDGSLFLITDS